MIEMKCIVTGASGHIGNVLVRDLLKQGYDVSVLLLKKEERNVFQNLNIQFFYGDVRDIDCLIKAFQGQDIVFHLAGIIAIGNGNKKLMKEVNIQGTKNVLKACQITKVRRLVYTSSVHAIAEKPIGEEISETDTFSKKLVKGSYAKTKAEATKYLLAHKKEGVEIVIVHPSGVIGPYEYHTSHLGQLIMDCINKKIGAYLDGGYNFVDVRDVVQGIVLASQKGRTGECYILDGHNISIRELMYFVQDITGVQAPKFKMARWFAYITGFMSEWYSKIVKEKPLFTSYAVYTLGTNSEFSHEKAEKELGYATREMRKTIFDTIKWFQKEGKISQEIMLKETTDI